MGLPVGNLFANGQENKRSFLCPSFTNFFAFKIISKLQNYLDKKWSENKDILLAKQKLRVCYQQTH